MNTVHLYLRAGATGSLNVARSIFDAGGHHIEHEIIPAAAVEAWLATQAADPEVKAIYQCHGALVTKPVACAVPWVPLPAGHPNERL